MQSTTTATTPAANPRVTSAGTSTKQPGRVMVARGLTKSYQKAGTTIPVLHEAHFAVAEGEFCAIVGQSGSGKSTLLHLLATLDIPDAGEVFYQGNRIDNLSTHGRDILRNQHFGMIFQAYHLLPELTTIENVMLPSLIRARVWEYFGGRTKYRRRAEDLLRLVGLAHRLRHRPRELSGGEMQRTAIARALMSRPNVLFADEPTGNLDRHTGDAIMEQLHCLNQQSGLTIVMVTHDAGVAAHATRTVRLIDNKIE